MKSDSQSGDLRSGLRTADALRCARRTNQGSILLVTLVLAVLLGTALCAYLSMLTQQKKQIARSQAWNDAVAVAEAGVEEALAQLNPGADAINVDLTANGWGSPSGGVYGPMTRILTNGTYTVYYTTNTFPIIYSTGTVSIASMPTTLSRVIKVATTNVPLFGVGMAAQQNINFNGNNITIDSFNSQTASNGLYTAAVAGTNGSIASVAGTVNVGNANVYGNVYLGPTATDSVKANGIITGTVYNDFNYAFPDVVLPTPTNNFWQPLPSGGSLDGTNYSVLFLTGGYFSANTVSGSICVAPGANVVLYITGSASTTIIRVAASGGVTGTLKLYMGGSSFTLSGQAVVESPYAANFQYYGLPSNTSITFSGNASYTGTIYAPEAAFTLGGGGSSTYDFVGASITKSVTMNGHFNFHYDVSLASVATRGFVAYSWQEL